MTAGQGSADISISDNLLIDPKKWILMAVPSITTSVKGDVTQITDYQLEQNYPNPFNPATKIKFSIPETQFVTLKVYDMLGNEIATLVNEQKQNGTYEVEFSAKGGSASGRDVYNLSSGIYLYKIVSGNYFETKKMILLR